MPASFCRSPGLWPWPLLSFLQRITHAGLCFIIHFWRKQVSGLVFTLPPYNGLAAASRQNHRASIIALSLRPKHMLQHMRLHKYASECQHALSYADIYACIQTCISRVVHIYLSDTRQYFSGNKGYYNNWRYLNYLSCWHTKCNDMQLHWEEKKQTNYTAV